MNCCQCDPIVKLSAEAERLIKILKILFFLYLFIIIIKLIVGDFNSAVNNIIAMIILVVLFLQANFMFAGFLIFFTLFNIMYALIFLGLRIQNRVAHIPDRYTYSSFYIPSIVVSVISLVFYIFLTYYTFLAYREFKALYFDYSYCKICLNLAAVERDEVNEPRSVDRNSNAPGFSAFRGQGTVVGGS